VQIIRLRLLVAVEQVLMEEVLYVLAVEVAVVHMPPYRM
jgi:hypothetical protein